MVAPLHLQRSVVEMAPAYKAKSPYRLVGVSLPYRWFPRLYSFQLEKALHATKDKIKCNVKQNSPLVRLFLSPYQHLYTHPAAI